MPQPISPELVLVDPELARVERARLPGHAPSEVVDSVVGRVQDVLPPQAPPREAPRQRSGGRAAAGGSFNRFALVALLTISLMATGVLVALKLPNERVERPALAPLDVLSHSEAERAIDHASSTSASKATRHRAPALTTHRENATTKPQSSVSSPTSRRTTTRTSRHRTTTERKRATTERKRGSPAVVGSKLRVETSAAVERKLLELVVQSPTGKLPPSLIDRTTGLAKNNIQAVCKRSGNSPAFRCVVQSASEPSAGRVVVDYRPTRDGRGRFTWPHRSG